MKFRTIFIGIVALVVLVLSVIQWQFLYPDFSQLIFGCGISFSILCGSYLWEWMELKTKIIENLSYRIDSLVLEFKEYTEMKGGKR